MAKRTTPAWAVTATWQRYALFILKEDAVEAMKAWKVAREAEGYDVRGKQDVSLAAYERDEDGLLVAKCSVGLHKLADHPVCYIGVIQTDVQRLRAMEEAENPAFDEYSARAKAISEGWEHVETL